MTLRISSGSIAMVLCAILLFPALSLAGDQVPYKDRVQAEITDAIPSGPNHVHLPFKASGQGTHVGKFTTMGSLLVDTTTFQFTGTNVLTAANGDRILIDITGSLEPTLLPDVFTIRVQTIFVGGTGRFVNVAGGFFGEGRLLLVPGFTGSTFTGVGEGTITPPRRN